MLHLIKGRSNPYPYPVVGCERHPSLDMVLDPGMASGTTLAKTPCQLWQSSVPAFPSVAANPVHLPTKPNFPVANPQRSHGYGVLP